MTSSPSRPSHPEALHFARFRVVRELGRGAQGAVFEAVDVERDVHVALKTLRVLGADDIARMKTEFRAVRDLRHPNLVRLGELVEEGGRWFFTMELVEGDDLLSYVRARPLEAAPSGASATDTTDTTISLPRPLATRLETRRPEGAEDAAYESDAPPIERPVASFEESRLRGALAQLVSALSHLHAAGTVHRDLKPSNVLVDAAGRVVVIDFGVAGELDAGDEEALVGTVAYMAPEQATGGGAGTAADWYAIGVMLFEAMTGRRPFVGSSREVVTHKCSGDAPSPSTFVRDLPADLEALCVRLLAQKADDRPTGAEVARALGVDDDHAEERREVEFVGRSHELEALAHAYEEVLAGNPVAVVLEGESGVGKSALARRFVEGLRGRDASPLVLSGRCHENESVPYNAFDAVIDGLARHVRARRPALRAELLPPHMDRVRMLFPTVGLVDDDTDEVKPSRSVVARAMRDEAFAALRELLRRASTHSPLVVLLEDVQWADADSLALLTAITQPPAAPPMLLVATARAMADGASCAAVRAIRGTVRRVPVRGLDAGEASALVLRLLTRVGRQSVDPEAVIDSARGHPLFIEELVRYLSRPRAHPRHEAVALDDALRARIAELDADPRSVLAVVAVAGVPTPQAAIAAAARVPFATYSDSAMVLHEAKLVRARGPRSDDPIEPFHDRVREAVYAGLEAAERKAIHAALARVFEERRAGPELLFHHFAAAGDGPRAVPYAQRAAEAASRSLAFDRAVELYQAALQLGARDGANRRALLVALGESLIDAGRSMEAARSFLEASKTGEPEPHERLDLLRRAAERFLMSGHIEEGLAATAVALDAAGLSLSKTWLGALARFGWYQLRLSRRPLTWLPRPAGDVEPSAALRMDLCWSVAAGLGLVDSLRATLFTMQGALECLDGGDDARIARALAGAAVGEAGLLRREESARLGAACRRAADAEGSDRSRFYVALVAMTEQFFLTNDWPACLAMGREAEHLWRSTGRTEGWEVDIVDQFTCWSLDNGGHFAELAERVPAKIRAAQRAGNRFIEVNFRTEFVNLRLIRDDPREARREVEEAIAAWPRIGTEFGNQDYLALRGLTSVALYERDERAAEALVGRWRRYFASLLGRVRFLRMDALWNVGAIALLRAHAARKRGEESVVTKHLREARRACAEVDRIDLPYARANAMQLRVGIATLERDVGAAIRTLRSAILDADARGAELHAAAMRARLGRLVGGDEGATLAGRAAMWMKRECVRDSERMTGTILPATGE